MDLTRRAERNWTGQHFPKKLPAVLRVAVE
jgi:hypothetical protein